MGQSSQPLLDPLVGSTIGRYIIQARVGEGGMGTVYRAEQTPLGRPVALKVIHRSLVSDQKVVSRFLREAKISCQLTNPHTVTIFDFGNEDGVLYLAMELLHGESLHERLARGPVEPMRASEIAAQVCRSLTEAHKKGIIHRDLKPDNIFLSTADDGSLLVKVLDYGLARLMSSDDAPQGIPHHSTLTQVGTIVGTPIYMSPEQARGRKLDARTDLYSMGVVLFEMLAGVAPFLDEDAVVVLGKHIRDPVPRIEDTGARISPPAAMQVLVDKLLEKEPSKRPPDANWVFQELRAYQSGTGSVRSGRLPALEDPSVPRPGPPPRVTPPDAESGVQARLPEPAAKPDPERESQSEWADTRASDAVAMMAKMAAGPDGGAKDPDVMDTHPTISLVLSEAPTIVPVSKRPSVEPQVPPDDEATRAIAMTAAGSLAAPISFSSVRRVPVVWLAAAIPVLAAAVALVATYSSDEVQTEPPPITATPMAPTTPPTHSPAAALPLLGASAPAATEPPAPAVAAPAAVEPPPPAGASPEEVLPAVPEGLTPREVGQGGWAGSYETSRGSVRLIERGSVVTGRFGEDGELRARRSDSVLRFDWSDGADEGHGVLRSFADAQGEARFLGTWGPGDPEGTRAWARSATPLRGKRPRVARPPTKRGGTGLSIGSDDIFGTPQRNPR